MLGEYRLIGVCTTKIHDELCSEFLQALFQDALPHNYRFLVFNSFLDFYYGDGYDQGAKSVYRAINFELIDMLIIDDRRFFDKELVNRLISEAHNRKIPVLTLYGSYEGCFSVIKNYEKTYKSLISHVIDFHGVKKAYFIGGLKGETDSELRLRCFREIMEQHGFPVDEKNIFYGDYWDIPVIRIIDKLVESNDVPQALICANDTMAVAACDRLAIHGIRVPEDVIVTGFDGLESVSFHAPRLTTCSQSVPVLSKLCIDVIIDAVEKHAEPYTVEEVYEFVVSESCGCHTESDFSYRKTADKLYSLVREMKSHEDIIYSWADRILESTDLSIIGQNLYEHILAGSAVALNSDFLASIRKGIPTDPDHPFSDKMVVISCRKNDYSARNQEVFELSEMCPDLKSALEEDVIIIFQAIFVEEKVCGYYIVKTSDIESSAHKLHRISRIMNIGFSTIVSRIEQEHMSAGMSEDKNHDALTGLLSLQGLNAKIAKNEAAYSKKCFAISVYNIPRYKFISDNYGAAAIDEAVCLVTEALRISNPKESLIARIYEDTFAIVNLESSAAAISDIIDHAVSVFFGITDSYQQSKNYFVEVNCGCYTSGSGWKSSELALYIKAAMQELQRNRIKYGTLPALKSDLAGEKYKLFDILIKKNLFNYHFQPIVDARTGDICAYEALMRTAEEIGMNPGEVLEVAKEYNRLYDVERATLFNVMEYINSHRDEFGDRRIFINIIPGNFLRNKDSEMLSNMYGHLFSSCTLEITELNEVTDENLKALAELPVFEVAIDDYGTGFSNIVSLLRFRPQVLKIDRFLISGIQNDANKQMFVKSTIDFAQHNNIKVLAEGVETLDELNAVIEYGVDLIQGFYTARPAPQPLDKLSDSIRLEIVRANENRHEFQQTAE